MFDTMKEGIKEESVGSLFNLQVQVQESPILEAAPPGADGMQASSGTAPLGGAGSPPAAAGGGGSRQAAAAGGSRQAAAAGGSRQAASRGRGARRSAGQTAAAAPGSQPAPGAPAVPAWRPAVWMPHGGRVGCSTARRAPTPPARPSSIPSRRMALTSPGWDGMPRARAARERSSSSATAIRVTDSAARQAASIAVQSHRACLACRPGVALRGPSRSSLTASARTRGPKRTTTVISTTSAAGLEATTRRTTGRSSAASMGPSRLMRLRACSVVHGTICRCGRDPASVSAST